MRTVRWLGLLGLLACGGKDGADGDGRVFTFDEGGSVTWIEPDPNLTGSADCTVDCPQGTQKLASDQVETRELQSAVDAGAFLLVEGACEATCVPVQPCFPPSVSVMTEAGYRCEALEGFAEFTPTSEVDLSFGTLWDPAEHVP